MSRICVSRATPGAAGGDDFVELRLDLIGASWSVPACDWIATCRPAWEGGRFSGSEPERRKVVEDAAARGAWAVDVENRASWRPTLPAGCRLILSHHDFTGVPADLDAIADRILAQRPHVAKIAAYVRDTRELRRMSALQDRLGERAVVIPMGDLGAPLRILAARRGAPWTYAAPDTGEPTAPGQASARDLRGVYHYEKIGPGTSPFCVAGDPVSHSRSPQIFNALFARVGISAVYVPARIPAGSLGEVLDVLGVAGASVTIPLKEEAFALGKPDAEANAAGAANTLRRHGPAWEATNTDGRGCVAALAAGLGRPPSKLRVLVLGAGGAARGVVAALAGSNTVTIAARSVSKAKDLAARSGAACLDWTGIESARWDLLVNATPVGMQPEVNATPISADALHAGAAVMDLVYTPRETRLLREAKARGCRVISGAAMFVEQAALQAEFWFGPTIRTAMREVAADWLVKG